MKTIITAKVKSSPAKDKNKKTLKRYWSLVYRNDIVEKMTAKVNER